MSAENKVVSLVRVWCVALSQRDTARSFAEVMISSEAESFFLEQKQNLNSLFGDLLKCLIRSCWQKKKKDLHE